jgi:hypothetical protein
MDSELAGIAAVKATTGTFLTADQTKLDGIAASANNYTLPSASATTVGGVELATTGETTTGTDTARAVTPAGVQAAIDALIGGAPGALDTLNELAAAINDDESYASTITTALGLKATLASPTFTGTVAIPNVANLETAVVANTAKATNVSTNLATTTSTTTAIITSSDGTDATIPVATTSVGGVMSKAIFDQHTANVAKNTNVSTALSTGTVDATSYGITSDGGSDDIILAQATTSVAGVLSAAKWDEIVANTAKSTNVVTNLTATANGTSLTVNSSDGTNVSLPAATTSAWGVMSDDQATKLDGIEASADVTDTANVVSALTAGTNVTISAGGTIASTDTTTNTMGSGFTVSATTDTNATTITEGDDLLFTAGTGITCETTADGTVTITNTVSNTNTQLSEEQVEDFVGGMLGGTETGITVTYQDATHDIDFVVADTTVAGDSGSTGITPGDTLTIAGGTNVTTAMSGDTLTITSTDTNTTYAKADFDLDHLFTLVGAAADTSVDLGTFTGSTVADSVTIKVALQSLETAVETKGVTAGSSSIVTVGTIGTGTWQGTAIGASYVATLNQNTTGSAATLTTPRAINGVNFNGSAPITVTAAGSTLSDTVTVAKGGTAQTSYTNGQLLIGNTTGNTLAKATLTAGDNVTITNGAGAITIAATDTNTTYTKASFDLDHLFTLVDAAADTSENLGTFTGSTISDSVTIKAALQALETAVETKGVTAGSSSIVTVGTIGTGTWQGTAIATAYIADDAITGAKIALFDDSLAATTTHFLIADGTDYSSFALSGDVTCTNAGAVTVAADAITYAKIQNVSATDKILGRDSAGAGIIEEISPANLRTMINVEDGATADQSNAEIKTAIEAGTDIALGGNPTTTTQSAGNNSTRIATTAYADVAVAALVDSAPAALDTLNELAAALGDDAGFSTTVTNSIATKMPLAGGAFAGAVTTNSTFDGRDVATDGTKLDGIEASATADQSAAEIKTLLEDGIDSVHYVDGSIDLIHLAADSVDGTKIADSAINSEHYADGSIDNAHIADDAIDSEHYAAGSIDTAHIADDQITLAKMAGITRGSIIIGDASGDPAALAIGSSTYVLTSDGTDIAWAAGGDITAVVAGTGMTGGATSGSATVNVIGGDGITANDNDVAVTPAQTTITSLLAADIKIGEDDQTKIDFETVDTINFYAGNEKQLILTDGALTPGTNAIVDLGTDALEFKDGYFDGTLEADAITIGGTALNTVIAGVTVTNATNAVTATNANHVAVADNESTDENNLITFIEDASATGNVGLESDGDFHYNPSTGTVTATIFKGNVDAVDGDFDGTLEADAITVGGTALNTVIAGVTVTNATNAVTATNANHVAVADNESTDENNLIPFIEDASATGNVGLESDGDFHYNPSSGTITATIFKGNIDAVDGDFDGTLEADAITIGGTALNTVIAGVTVTNATTAVNATHVAVADNESTDENNLITFIEDASATGNVGLESDGDFHYNPSTGTVTATIFKGNIDAVDGDFDGTLEADAITLGGTALGSLYSVIAGSSSILTVGTIGTGIWQGTAIAGGYIANDAIDSQHYAAASIDYAHVQNVAANSILGRNANSAGVLSEIALTTTQILIGDGTGFTAAALSGDVTMTNAGVVSIADDVVSSAELADACTAVTSFTAPLIEGSTSVQTPLIEYTDGDDAITIADGGLCTFPQLTTFSKAIKPGLKADTDGATVTFDLNEPNMHTVTLGGNRTFAISNETAGQRFIIRVLQDGTGSRLVSTWFSTIKWAGGSAPTLTTTANKADVFGFIVTGTDTYDGFIVGQNV